MNDLTPPDSQFDESSYELLVHQILSKVPTLSIVANDLANLLHEDANHTIAYIEELVSRDQAMIMNILRVANSPFFREGNNGRVSDLGEAIFRVGFDQINQIVLSFSVFKLFRSEKDVKFKIRGLWEHSLGVASLSRRLVGLLDREKGWHNIAYTSGMIHDIGKVVRYRLDKFEHTESLSDDSRLALLESITFKDAEIINDRVRHDYLGYVLCKCCRFMEFTQDVVRWHHEPEPRFRKEMSSEDSHFLVDVVIVANWLAHRQRFGFSGHKVAKKPPNSLFERLGFDQRKLESFQQEAPGILDRARSLSDFLF